MASFCNNAVDSAIRSAFSCSFFVFGIGGTVVPPIVGLWEEPGPELPCHLSAPGGGPPDRSTYTFLLLLPPDLFSLPDSVFLFSLLLLLSLLLFSAGTLATRAIDLQGWRGTTNLSSSSSPISLTTSIKKQANSNMTAGSFVFFAFRR